MNKRLLKNTFAVPAPVGEIGTFHNGAQNAFDFERKSRRICRRAVAPKPKYQKKRQLYKLFSIEV